jgi:hypothetical protein
MECTIAGMLQIIITMRIQTRQRVAMILLALIAFEGEQSTLQSLTWTNPNMMFLFISFLAICTSHLGPEGQFSKVQMLRSCVKLLAFSAESCLQEIVLPNPSPVMQGLRSESTETMYPGTITNKGELG